MKTMKDFKGTQGELEVRKVNDNHFSHEMYADNDKFNVVACLYNRDEESDANARLFANSKRVLEAAIYAYDALKFLEQNRVIEKMRVDGTDLLTVLEKAINDSLSSNTEEDTDPGFAFKD